MKLVSFLLLCMMPLSAIGQDSTRTEKGYFNITEAGVSFGFDRLGIHPEYADNHGPFLLVMTTHGRSFNHHFKLGGGIGFQKNLRQEEFYNAMIPVFADFRYVVLKKRITPYIGQKLGAVFYVPGITHLTPGIFYAADIGLWVRFKRRAAFSFSVGYQLFNSLTTRIYGNEFQETTFSISGSFLSIKTGLSF